MNSTPRLAALPVPVMMAVGVASPSEHGQAITSTATNICIQNAAAYPAAPHALAAITDTAITTGTNMPAILSASLAMGALEFCASSTIFIILARAVSAPTPSARKVMAPLPFMVPPNTLSPGTLSTGILSPVSMLSFTSPPPSVTTPSQQKLSPALTNTISPATTCSEGMSIRSPPRTTVATLGVSAVSAAIALPVFFKERCSRYLPKEISAMMTDTDSK